VPLIIRFSMRSFCFPVASFLQYNSSRLVYLDLVVNAIRSVSRTKRKTRSIRVVGVTL